MQILNASANGSGSNRRDTMKRTVMKSGRLHAHDTGNTMNVSYNRRKNLPGGADVVNRNGVRARNPDHTSRLRIRRSRRTDGWNTSGACRMLKRTGLAYSKLRDRLSMCGVEIEDRKARVRVVREWDAFKPDQCVADMAEYWTRYEWDATYIEQETGEYLIDGLKRAGVPLRIITTQKKVKEAAKIRGVRVMDRVEATEFLRKLKIGGQIFWPRKRSDRMQEMFKQIGMFAKHSTEAGNVDYYSAGNEPDGLVRALMIVCFSARPLFGAYDGVTYVGQYGPDREDSIDDIEQQMQDLRAESELY